MERGTRFELAHPRVEALVHSLFYVTPAKYVGTVYKNHSPSQVYFCSYTVNMHYTNYEEQYKKLVIELS